MKSVPIGADRLLAWFDDHKRELPWRLSTDPYRVLVSEVMLQQTQVDRVIPYFERFLERFPTVEALATAPIEDVLARWSGLGYYRRARMLHAAARQIVVNGEFPSDVPGLRGLPGVGYYTAAAIASIAFGVVVAAIDGNIERAVSRFAAIPGDLKKATGRRLLEESVEGFLDHERPGDSNQALMELGATVCRPQNPECANCPLSFDCAAYRNDEIALFPAARKRRSIVKERRLAVVVENAGKILLFRRPDGAGQLAGLWEIPWVPWIERNDAPAKLSSRYGGNWKLNGDCGWVRHSITRRDIRIEVYRGNLSVTDEIAEGSPAGWFGVSEMQDLALSSLVDKIVASAATGG